MTKLEQLKKEIQMLRQKPLVPCDCPKGGYEDMVCQKCDDVQWKIGDFNLEDVLAVLQKEVTLTSDWFLLVSVYGGIYKHNGFSKHQKVCDWLLGKPLDDQTEETINFLFSLIFK